MADQRRKFAPLTSNIVGRTREGRNIFKNVDGTRSSERSVTIEADGRHFNIPTIFNGKELTPKEAFDIIIKNDFIDPETGRKVNSFATEKEALDAAEKRSPTLGEDMTTTQDRMFPSHRKAK